MTSSGTWPSLISSSWSRSLWWAAARRSANLFFQLVSARYERASLIVPSNKPFGRWGEVFRDDVVAAAMIDRLVHHAEVLALKGDSYPLRNRDLGRVPAATTDPT